jgi:hypothetical protein
LDEKSATRRFVNTPVLIPVPAITLSIHRRADYGARDSTDRAADDCISRVIASGQRSKRSTADAADHGALFRVGAAGKGRDCRKSKNQSPHSRSPLIQSTFLDAALAPVRPTRKPLRAKRSLIATLYSHFT